MADRLRILAVASGGGHWVQLLRLRPSLDAHDTAFVSVYEASAEDVPGSRYHVVPDSSRFTPFRFVLVLLKAAAILLAERPHFIVTTGSAPMLFFIGLGRLIGARTLWIDSIANSERMSSSGRLARKIAHRCVSQWPDVAAREGVQTWGAVI